MEKMESTGGNFWNKNIPISDKEKHFWISNTSKIEDQLKKDTGEGENFMLPTSILVKEKVGEILGKNYEIEEVLVELNKQLDIIDKAMVESETEKEYEDLRQKLQSLISKIEEKKKEKDIAIGIKERFLNSNQNLN